MALLLPHLLDFIPWFRKKETRAFWMGKYITPYLSSDGGSWILLFLPLFILDRESEKESFTCSLRIS